MSLSTLVSTLGAPVVVCGQLLEGDVALEVLGAVTLGPRETAGWLKISVTFKGLDVYLGVHQVGKAGGLDRGPLGGVEG